MGRWVNGYSIVGIGRIDLGHNNHGKKRNYFRLCWLNKPSSMENEPDGAKKGQQLACCARGPCFETLGRRTTRPSRVRPLCPSTVNCLEIHMRVLAQSERDTESKREGAGETIPDCVVSARGQPNGMVRDVATTAAIYQSQLRLTRTKTLIIAQA